MLTDLRVRDLGVIEDLTLAFGPGMTALTGETGAGKTLVVEALQLLLGGRANPGLVRAGATEALVEARFVVDVEGAEREVVLVRSVPAEGRSKAWVDGRMAPVGVLGEVTAELVEIHGQHEHRALVTAAAQRNVLDAFAGTDVSEVRALQAEQRGLESSLAALGGDAQQRAREADVLRYQVHEIQGARLEDPDEDAKLRVEEEQLADASALREGALLAAELLDPVGGEGGAAGPLGEAVVALSGRDAFEDYRGRVAAATVEIADVAHALRAQAERWEDDPARLAEVQERRRLLAELRRKYGEDLVAVKAYAGEAAERLAVLEDAEGEAARLTARQEALSKELEEAESAVRAVRAAAAGAFGRRVEEHLGDLAMTGAELEVRLSPDGAGEPVELWLGANVGEPMQPLARAASGGELARAMLAIRLVGLGGPQTMVFDEVDAGVGGASALALGEALHAMAADRQVLVVTHLAQVASRANAQVSVVKQESDGRTVTVATAVTGEERVTELSRMLSGHPGSDAARAHARELLGVGGGGGTAR